MEEQTELEVDRRARPSRVAAIVAAALVLPIALGLASPNGPQVSPDSFAYLGAAASLADGTGLTTPFGEPGAPVTLWPPAYPAVLAIGATADAALSWALWVNLAALAALSIIAGLAILRATESAGLACLAALLAATGPVLMLGAWVLSEPLFLALAAGTLAALGEYRLNVTRRPLVAAAVLTALALLTRYAGLSLLLTGLLIVATARGRRLRDVGLYLGIAVSPLLLWLMRNLAVSGTATGAKQPSEGLGASDLLRGIRTGLDLVVGGAGLDLLTLAGLAAWIVLVACAGVGGAALLARRTARGPVAPPIALVFLTYSGLHVAILLGAHLLSSRTPPLNERMLAPAYVGALVGLLALGHAMWSRFPERLFRATLATGLACFVILQAVAAVDLLTTRRQYDAGSAAALDRATARWGLDALPADATLYAEQPGLAWYASGRPVRALPVLCSRLDRTLIGDTPDVLADWARGHAASPDAIVLFPSAGSEGFGRTWCDPTSLSSAVAEAGLAPTADPLPDGVLILRPAAQVYPPSSSQR